MYTSYIGKKFLKLYNQKKQTALSAKAFFDEVFFPVFFNDEQHLMHVGNSPFFQKPTAKALAGGQSKSELQKQKLVEDISREPPNMAIFVGYAAKDIQGTTSGQLTSMNFGIDIEEMYASWLGQSLAIGVNGGFVMLIPDDAILWTLYEGWQLYRDHLTQTSSLKDKQIETWNGHWLCHAFGRDYNPDDILYGFEFKLEMLMGKLSIPTKDWVQVLFSLSRKYPNRTLTAYAYNLSQTNTTLGFINLYLPEVRNFFDVYAKIIPTIETEDVTDSQLEKLYKTALNFRSACLFGQIGLRAIEPYNLRQFMPRPIGSGNDYRFTDNESYLFFQIYKTWIIAMISNKEELDKLASRIAKTLLEFENQSDKSSRGKTEYSRLTEEVRSAKTLRDFIEKLAEVMDKNSDAAEVFKEAKNFVLRLPSDLFPLFITLVRFEFIYLKTQK